MEKSQLQEKVQKHVDELFLNLSQNLAIDVSENVKKRFYQSLYNEAVASFQKQFRETVTKETENMFFCLETDLNFSFKEQTKKDLLATLLVEVLDSEENISNENEAKKADISEDASDEKEESQITSQENDAVSEGVEDKSSSAQDALKTNEVHDFVDSLLYNAEIAEAKKSRVEKPWKEQCDDPDIINRVNKILKRKFDFDDSLLDVRSCHLRNDLAADSLDATDIVMKFENEFNCSIPDNIAGSIQTVGDAYDAVWYFLKKKNHR